MALHIPSLTPETIFHIGAFPVTNTLLNAWMAMAFFLFVGLLIRGRLSLRPNRLQNWGEGILEMVFGYFDQVSGSRQKTLRFLPMAGSVFFFILFSNWLGLLPGTGSITWNNNFILRPANTDLNLTVAMALFAVFSSHLFGFLTVGFFTHAGKYLPVVNFIKSFKKGPIAVFVALIEVGVGLIEIVSEAAKILSLSLRLFGNIFAGEVLITVMLSLVSWIVPLPFMLLELLVGLIQASVFAILTLVYLTLATAEPHGSEEEH